MHKKSEPQYVSDARLRLDHTKKRIKRQTARLERIKLAGGDPSGPNALLGSFVRCRIRCERYLQMVLGWFKKHPRGKFPRILKNRFMNPQSAAQSRKGRFARWDKEVKEFLEGHYPNAPHYKASLIALWDKFQELGLPTTHFVSEFTSGKKSVMFQRAWEMMLARHLDAQGYRITTADDRPDFRIEHEGKVIWIEAVCPEPIGVPQDFMEGPKPDEFKVGDIPHTEVLLRWTTAIKAKCDKLKEYRAKGIVGESDGYVIAVNGCQLGAMPLHHGVSQFPYALEAVYPAGPIAITIDRATGKVIQSDHSLRPAIKKAQGDPVPTTLFIDKEYAGVSAVAACSMDRSDEATLPLDVIHNHLAAAPIPHGFLGKDGDEWITELDGKGGINVFKRAATEDQSP